MMYPQPHRTQKFCHDFSQWLLDELSLTYDVVCSTIHGSYLYGIAHENSDIDGFVILSPQDNVHTKKEKNIMSHGLDIKVLDFHHFFHLIDNGSHQAVEALYSPYMKYTNSPYAPMIRHAFPTISHTVNKAQSAAEGHYHRGIIDDNRKMLTHYERLEDSAYQHVIGKYSPVWKNFSQ